VETLRASVHVFGKFIQTLLFGKDHIRKRLICREALQVASPESFHQLLVISALDERAAANHRQIALASQFDSLRKTLQSRVTFVFDLAAGLGCFRMGGAAVGFAELCVLGRSLKRVTNGIIVGNDDCGRLMTVNQKQGKPRIGRESILNLRPRGRGVFAVFLSVWGNGGFLDH
jgi:hypothetical protein